MALLSCFTLAFVVQENVWFQPNYPKSWPTPEYDYAKYPLSNAQVQLGRKLFYDPILSADSTISCSSCHLSFTAFSHVDHDLSHGIGDSIGTRNAPGLANLAWQRSFMWDGAVPHIELQALAPISHPAEMGEDIKNVVEKLKRQGHYTTEFKQAYPDKTISGETILKALAAFQLTIISVDSKYDKVKRGEATFNAQEQKGYALFQRHCNNCHTEPMFSNYQFANNGLRVDTTLNDWGRMKVSGQSKDSLLFKVPSLRNVGYTFPYMHDGRFQSLHQVLKHYAQGIVEHSTLSKELQHPMSLTANDRVDLVAFLNTLNDSAFVFNPEYGFPRKK